MTHAQTSPLTDTEHHDEKYIATPRQVAMTLTIISLLGAVIAGAIALFGWPVLGLVALACVPIVFVCLILLTVGK
ncbi:hypothetical protein [Pacificibacter marinus]|uniref:hypothetical protein n=1 Tax=Pacificibacter marinus TaxID=658057 RepID=UPI001C07BA07|nr:hypothetical protein [Pacificibacter marinus]MBU2866904.1 hypothetical protein [Pacificibacter marinus]